MYIYESGANAVGIILFCIDTVNDTVNEKTSDYDTVNDTVNNLVLDLIKQNTLITSSEISKQLNISLSTVKRKLKALKDTGKIARVGSDKTGYWKIK